MVVIRSIFFVVGTFLIFVTPKKTNPCVGGSLYLEFVVVVVVKKAGKIKMIISFQKKLLLDNYTTTG